MDKNKVMWFVAYALVAIGGVAHISATALAGILSLAVLGVTVQQIAGVVILIIGVSGLLGTKLK